MAFQQLISDFSDNPLKLNKSSCRRPQICSIRDICLPFSKTTEISPFWCEWELLSTRYSKEKKQKQGGKKGAKKRKKSGKKKDKKMSDKKVPCPPHTPLLSISHHSLSLR